MPKLQRKKVVRIQVTKELIGDLRSEIDYQFRNISLPYYGVTLGRASYQHLKTILSANSSIKSIFLPSQK